MPYIDSHLHYVDFLQHSDGMKVLLKAMDRGKISKAVLMGLPLIKKWDSFEKVEPHRYLDNDSKCYYYSYTDQITANAFSALDATTKNRFAPLLCGFNPTDLHGIQHVQYLLEHYPFWKGVGELLLRHDSLTNITNEETARANHPALQPIYQLCTKRNLPIVIHQDSTAVDRSDIYEYVDELRDVLNQFPKLKLIWAHGGVSEYATHKFYYKMIQEMLKCYGNLTIDLSWIIFDQIIFRRGEIAKHWLATIEQFSQRFIIGSDVIGDFNRLPQTIKRYDQLLKLLTPASRQLVSYENANRLFFG